MGLKGTLQPNHIATNRYELHVIGLPPLTPVTVSGISEELLTTDLPDRTRATGGDTNPTEVTIALPAHHDTEIAAMELWFGEAKAGSPTYKKAATLIMQTVDGTGFRSYSLIGVFPTSRSSPDLDMANDGDIVNISWALSVDEVIPV